MKTINARRDLSLRERLNREQGPVIKDWGGRLPVALIYPNSYFLGMSNLGLHAIYSFLNGHDDIVCERVFLEKGQPTLALESQRPLSDFAVLAFTISYELDYFNIPPVLKAGGIPLYASQRDETHPLLIAGGPCVTANPMPLSPFFDCLCIGEAEPILPLMLPILTAGISEKRADLLKKLAQLPGVYVPRFSQKQVARQWTKNLDEFLVTSAVLTPDTELGDLYLVEVERGCNWACRFCLVSTAFRPMRFRAVDKLLEQARRGLNYRKRIGLVGPAVSDHPYLDELLAGLYEMGAQYAISSLRVSQLSEKVLEQIAKGGTQTITIAPEAGSERLRNLIRKGICEDDVLRSVDSLARMGIRQLKLYFMLGLPTETDEDIEEIAKLTLRCKGIIEQRRSGARLTLNLSPFVPKAGTPFQRLPMAPLSVLKQRLSYLKSRLQPEGIKLNTESPEWTEVQAVLARGDEKLAKVLAEMEGASLAGWRQETAKQEIDIDFYAHEEWLENTKLPWGMIGVGVGESQH